MISVLIRFVCATPVGKVTGCSPVSRRGWIFFLISLMVNGYISLPRDLDVLTEPLFQRKQIWRSSVGFQKNRDPVLKWMDQERRRKSVPSWTSVSQS